MLLEIWRCILKTVCYIAHDAIDDSSSQQFLLQAGRAMTQVCFIDLSANQGVFDTEEEINRLLEAEQIIFQFPLYWYQAPAILKSWIDTVWTQIPINKLNGKILGLVVVIGGKKSHYQIGGRHGRTLSELLIPYSLLAQTFGMVMKIPFEIYQFQFMTEEQKKTLMWHYLFYLENRENETFEAYQSYLLSYADGLSVESTEHQCLWELFKHLLHNQAEELNELSNLTKGWS